MLVVRSVVIAAWLELNRSHSHGCGSMPSRCDRITEFVVGDDDEATVVVPFDVPEVLGVVAVARDPALLQQPLDTRGHPGVELTEGLAVRSLPPCLAGLAAPLLEGGGHDLSGCAVPLVGRVDLPQVVLLGDLLLEHVGDRRNGLARPPGGRRQDLGDVGRDQPRTGLQRLAATERRQAGVVVAQALLVEPGGLAVSDQQEFHGSETTARAWPHRRATARLSGAARSAVLTLAGATNG